MLNVAAPTVTDALTHTLSSLSLSERKRERESVKTLAPSWEREREREREMRLKMRANRQFVFGAGIAATPFDSSPKSFWKKEVFPKIKKVFKLFQNREANVTLAASNSRERALPFPVKFDEICLFVCRLLQCLFFPNSKKEWLKGREEIRIKNNGLIFLLKIRPKFLHLGVTLIKPSFSSSLKLRRNKLECFYVESFFSQVYYLRGMPVATLVGLGHLISLFCK